MKILFAGTPPFAAAALEALVDAGHHVLQVLTQPDRPAGRGLKPQCSAVKQAAVAHGLPVMQPESLKDPAVVAALAALDAEVMVVAAYGLILPPAVLALPPRGCLNIHASLLPRWRGAAPIQRAILGGDAETGITIMQMDQGLDTGAMLLKVAVPILATDNAASLHDTLAGLGARLIVRALQEFPSPVTQDPAQATYAAKITRAEAALDWTRPAAELDRQVRAFNPVPGAHTLLQGQLLKIWQAQPVTATGAAGSLLSADANGIVVAAGDGALRVLELQRAGGKRLAAAAFLAGVAVAPGTRLGI